MGEEYGIQGIYEATREDEVPAFLCPFCSEGIMVPADEERDVPTYVCPACGAYHGEFLHTGAVFYYTPLHLRVGRAIIARGGLGKPHSISALSVELSHEFGEWSAGEIAEAILYLEKNGILRVQEGQVVVADESGTRITSSPSEGVKEGTEAEGD